MTQLTLSEAVKLNGIESWKLSPEEQGFLLLGTERMVKEHGQDWVVKNQKYLQESLKEVFSLL